MEKKTILMASGLMMMMLILSATTARADLCQDALTALLPACMPFLKSSDPPTPSANCCLGVHEVLNKAITSEDHKALCVCFKKAAAQNGVKSDWAEQLLDHCKIKSPVPIKPDVDCNKL